MGGGGRRRGPKRKVSATFAKETRVPIAIEQTRETNARKKKKKRERRSSCSTTDEHPDKQAA